MFASPTCRMFACASCLSRVGPLPMRALALNSAAARRGVSVLAGASAGGGLQRGRAATAALQRAAARVQPLGAVRLRSSSAEEDMDPKIKDLVDQIASLSLLEAAQLTDALKARAITAKHSRPQAHARHHQH